MDAKKTFLIAPVRGYPPGAWGEYVKTLESDGWSVFWPARDTAQHDDPTGIRICRDNRTAIGNAHAVHLIWDGKSTGCLFDLGVAWALCKPIIILELPEDATNGKSFLRMPRAWAEEGPEVVG